MSDAIKDALANAGIVLQAGNEFDTNTPISFSTSIDGLEGTGKTSFIIMTMPRPQIHVNFGDRSAVPFLYKMAPEEREGLYLKDIQPTSPEGWTFSEAVDSLKTLNQIVATSAPLMPGGTFALDGGSSWWSVMQQVFVEPKENARIAAGSKKTGGIVYEEANNRVRGIIGHIRASGCFLAITHQMTQEWDANGPIIGKWRPKKNSQIPFLMECQVTLTKKCANCGAWDCSTEGHMGRVHMALIKSLKGNTAMEGLYLENLMFPDLYQLQTGRAFPRPEALIGEARVKAEKMLADEGKRK